MIKVTIFKDKKGYIGRYNISGHAGYDIKGKDIVCAAVSVLAQTTLVSLVEVCGVPEKEIDYTIDEENGIIDVTISKVIDDNLRMKTEIVLKTLEVGIKSILENYPEYVTLKYREV
ncbi:ribosomal-processing cysteine protease Prp [Clostridium sp. Cult2]|uniref:ribosomal-processing cysteine protease Prp n=1 Tax=Clostridium sp. Cult2 TaxID=2079003 RepID=UPI001F3721DB|nr:ribosomal-processing cysteine protease Prp [Clostridium sp. Cult2]MCF6465364.1 ribosomal-processing cysteine protease Prp [Clostridium sp. Cult2]